MTKIPEKIIKAEEIRNSRGIWFKGGNLSFVSTLTDKIIFISEGITFTKHRPSIELQQNIFFSRNIIY